MVSRSIYNLKIDTIYMYGITFDRSFLQLSNGMRHGMPSTDTKPELTAKASVAQPVSQPAVYANGLIRGGADKSLAQPTSRCRTASIVSLERGVESCRRHGCLSVVSVVCCQIVVSATGRSLIQRSATECACH
jgi:hypothetical protein